MSSLAPSDHIILDCIDTWPIGIRNLIAAEEAWLRLYVEENRRLDALARNDVMLKIRPPVNRHRAVWVQAAQKVRELVDHHAVVGFHCTRLIPDEIDDIRANGLRPLTRAFTCQRIDGLVGQKLMTPDLAAALKRRDDSPWAGGARREGLISFVHCLLTLRRDEGGLYRLLRYWGGEAIYGHHEEHSSVKAALSSIGTPCIVLATLQPSDVGRFKSFEERLIGVWLDRGSANALPRDCDTQIENRSVPVLDVVEYTDPRFEQLTGSSRWGHSIDSSA